MPVYTYSFNYVHLLVNIYDIYKYRLFVNYNPFERDSFFLYFHFIFQTFSLSLSFFLSIYNIQYIYIYISTTDCTIRICAGHKQAITFKTFPAFYSLPSFLLPSLIRLWSGGSVLFIIKLIPWL